jgi:hypothetical protein
MMSSHLIDRLFSYINVTNGLSAFMNQKQPHMKLVTKLTILSKKLKWTMMRAMDFQKNYPETFYETTQQFT